MELDQEMHAHGLRDDDGYSTIYPPDLHSYTSPSSFMGYSGHGRQSYLPSDDFGTSHPQDRHEAEHVFGSPQLTLDPSTLDLRSNSNDNPPPSSVSTSGSNNTTPTGTLRLAAYNQPIISGVTTRRKGRAPLEQLQIQIEVGVNSDVHIQSPQDQQDSLQYPEQELYQHQQSDMHDARMHTGDMHMHVDDRQDHELIAPTQGRSDSDGMSQAHSIYAMNAMLSDGTSQPTFYDMSPDAFSHSPTGVSTPPDASPHSDMQTNSPVSPLGTTAPSSGTMTRGFRPGPVGPPLSLGITANRSMPLIHPISAHGSPGQMSPSHVNHAQLSSHPHMHPTPYYSVSHSSGSPNFPSTPITSHHTQGSSSSSHSSGHTRYSLRGSPAPRSFGRSHGRSNSYGTVSTMSVRSSSPASSVASAFTSLSGGASGGSASASTCGPVASPTSYEEGRDVSMTFANNPSPLADGSHPDVEPLRAQSHPPLSMPTAHSAVAPYSALLSPSRKSMIQGSTGYMPHGGPHFMENSRGGLNWPSHPPDAYCSPQGHRLTDEEFQAQFPPKPIVTRAPHRKQKLANSDRKAICMYAKQHPSARQEDIAARYNVERSTISKILKNKERWLGCPDDDAKVARKRKPRFDDLELVLKLWVEGTKPQGILLSDALIRSKAKEEARRLGILEDKFKASSGWLENFKHRVGIRKGKYIGRDQWQEGSDSDGEEALLASKQVQDQRMIWQSELSHDSEQTNKGLWAPPANNSQSHDNTQLKKEGIEPSMSESPTLNDLMRPLASTFPSNEHGLTQVPEDIQHTGPVSDTRPTSHLEVGKARVGMRKTRSRTLAEAREAEITTSGGSISTVEPTLGTVSALASPIELNEDSPHGQTHDSFPGLDASSAASSSTIVPPPDGRDVSAGLDAALDFIGSQPDGFATPEEVTVLRNLRRRLSCAEIPRQHATSSLPTDWTETGET